ncbi:hypothetical protein RB195_012158 [Necator americanus]|uniref:[histone H3]-lysine(4) N-trimethyltransferase n=1 Tax=Necator americanus TaxID=51031 RepID=A0ABR1D716_NECAM
MRSSTAEAGDRKAAPAPRPSHGPGPPRPHPPHGVQQGPRNYKTLYDKELGAKETIRRYNGHIPGHPKYDVKLPLSDPRNHYIQFRTIAQADLVVPSFTVDRNTVFYPKVEVAMFDLNDNVNKAFLQQLANKVAPPIDLEVFYHPITKKHMGMAMIVFSTYEEARRFVHEYNMRTVMGSQVSCCHDPYFTLLSQRYEDATGEEMRIPVHLKGLEETILNTRRSHFAMKNEVLQRGRPSSSSLYAAEQTEHVDMDMESPTVPSVDVIQRGLDKRNTPCTPVPEVSTPRNEILVRGTNTPARPRTPPMEPPITTSAPPTVPLPAVVPPPNAFLPQIPPPMIPPFHPGTVNAEDRASTSSGGPTNFQQNTWSNPTHCNSFNMYGMINNCLPTFPLLPWPPYDPFQGTSNFDPPINPMISPEQSPTWKGCGTKQNHGYAGFCEDRRVCMWSRHGRAGFENDLWDERTRPQTPHSVQYSDDKRCRPYSGGNFGNLKPWERKSRNRVKCGSWRRRNCDPRSKKFYRRDGFVVRRYYYEQKSPDRFSEGPSEDHNNNDSRNLELENLASPLRKKSRWDDPGNDFISSQSQPGPSGAPIPPIPPIPPVFGMTYPPPPPYSAVPADGSAIFPPGYPHPSIGAPVANVAEEKATTSQSEPPQESRRGKRENRSRPHKKKKKKRRRRSSDSSSSSTSGSSLNIGEYLRVEKKEMSTKYISREREGREKTIVEEIKTITKRKKYTVTESKRNDIKQTPGLQKISSDESDEKAEVEEEKFEKEQSPSPSKISEKEKKIEGHRWSSSSTDSDVELTLKKDKKTEKTLSASSSHHDLSSRTPVPPIVAPPAPPPVVFSPETHSLPHVAAPVVSTPTLPPPPTMGIPLPPPGANIPLPPTHLPPPPFPLPPMNPAIPLGAPAFNPLLPPPNFCPPPPQVYVKRDFPKVALRFVEEPPSCPTTSTPSTSSHQTLADRVASIFGADVGGQSRNARPGSSISQRQGSDDAVCDDVDDMDVDVGSSISPPPEGLMSTSPVDQMRRNGKEPRRTRQGTADKEKRQFAKNVAVVREATEKTIGEEIVDVVTKDFYKRVEGVSFEILEEVLAEIRHELEEQKRNEAQEALRAQAQMVTPEKPSDVAQLCSPLSASLNATPEKLGAFPFTINMPKLPSFRRKVRPPSPESESETRSPLVRKCDEESDDSDVAHKSSSSSQNSSESSDEVVLRRKGQAQRNRSLSASGSESSSELSSNESEHQSRKSSQSSKSVQKLDTPSVVASTAVSTASSVASSSESTPPSDDEERDASTITEEPIPVPIVEPEVEKEDLTPLWEKILGDTSLDWSEGLPRTLYHVSLTEHCYFKLPENEKKTGEENAKDVTVQVQVRVEDKQEKVPAPPKKTKATKVDRELLRLFPAVEIRAPPKPKVIYPPWTDEERKRHIYCWDCCFDPEDQEYLRQAWTDLQPAGDDAKPPPWIRPVRFNFRSWADKPRLLDKPVKKGRVDQYFADGELDGILPIEGGCARTRGYFKMTAKEKRSLIRRPEDEQRDKTVINERDEAAVRHNLVLTKESRSMHRRLLTTMGDANTDFFKVNQLKYRKKMIKFARSRIHGWGLYAMEAIAPDDMIVEYVGQKVRNTVADVREKAYERRGIGSSYLFRIDDTTVIDATRMGNFARFINHSCQPNCYAKVVTVDGDKRIVIYSKTLINKGDEITYDYKFPIEDDKVDCLCGAPNCRGTLN